MLPNPNFLCLFPRLYLITPSQHSIFTGCLGETSSNNNSGEFSLLPYRPSLCAGKRPVRVNERGHTEDHEQSLFTCQGGTAGKSSGLGTRILRSSPLLCHWRLAWLWTNYFTKPGLSFPIRLTRYLNQITSKALAVDPIIVSISHRFSRKRTICPCVLPHSSQCIHLCRAWP